MALWLATTTQQQVQSALPRLDPEGILLTVLGVLPIVGAFILARESKGRLPYEAGAALLMVLVISVPIPLTRAGLPVVLPNFIAHIALAVFLLGLAFISDGGMKMILGLLLLAASGFVILPR